MPLAHPKLTDGDGWMAKGPDVTFRAVAKFVPAAAAAGLKNISRGSFARPFSSVGPAPNKAEERRDRGSGREIAKLTSLSLLLSMGNGRAAEEGIVEVQKTLREDGGRRPFAAHQSEFKSKNTLHQGASNTSVFWA